MNPTTDVDILTSTRIDMTIQDKHTDDQLSSFNNGDSQRPSDLSSEKANMKLIDESMNLLRQGNWVLGSSLTQQRTNSLRNKGIA